MLWESELLVVLKSLFFSIACKNCPLIHDYKYEKILKYCTLNIITYCICGISLDIYGKNYKKTIRIQLGKCRVLLSS